MRITADLGAEDQEVVGGDSVAPAGLGLVSPGLPGEGGHALCERGQCHLTLDQSEVT